ACRAGRGPVRLRHRAVRRARPNRAAVAVEADAASRPGDRRVADRPRGGRCPGAAGEGRAALSPRRHWICPVRRAAIPRARPLPPSIRMGIPIWSWVPDLLGHDAADRGRGPGALARRGRHGGGRVRYVTPCGWLVIRWFTGRPAGELLLSATARGSWD